MRRVLGRAFTSASLVACGMILGHGASSALAQVPRPPAGTYYVYPAPGSAGPSAGYATRYSYEPAPVASSPAPGYYYYPQMPEAGRPAGYYYYPGAGYVRPPQSASTPPGYATPSRTYTAPAQAVRRGRFGFPIPANRSPRPGEDDDYAYKS